MKMKSFLTFIFIEGAVMLRLPSCFGAFDSFFYISHVLCQHACGAVFVCEYLVICPEIQHFYFLCYVVIVFVYYCC